MAVVNLQPGDTMDVAAGQIRGTLNVYRTGQGYSSPGTVGWQPEGGALQIRDIAVGETVTFRINGAAGTVASGAPSMIQLLWDGAAATSTKARGLAMLRPAPVPAATPGASHTGGADVATAFSAADSPATSPGSQAMQTLTAQWYNAVTGALSLSPGAFQLFQGNAPLGTLSEALWNVYDAVPPVAIAGAYDPQQANTFSSNYGAIIQALKYPNDAQLQRDMGDYYPKWIAYQSSAPPLSPGQTWLDVFTTWAQANIPDPATAQAAIGDFGAAATSTVGRAQGLWNASGGAGTAKPYTTTISQVTNSLIGTPSKTVTMDSRTASANVDHTWAQGRIEGVFEFFGGEGSASYDSLTSALVSAGISISATFTYQSTVAAGPLSTASSDPTLSQYKPWFLPAALNLAYQNDNNLVWREGQGIPTWDNFFGSNGTLLHLCSALVIVDGVSITMTSQTGFDSSDQQTFTHAASGGVWPFFYGESSGGWSNTTTFDAHGNVTIKSSSKTGNPVILGIIASPVAAAAMLD